MTATEAAASPASSTTLEEHHQRLEHFTSDLERVHTQVTNSSTSSLTQEHQDYLMKRHGTLDLDPVPGFGDADPYNWPQWKKVTNLVLVAFHAAVSSMIAAAIIPAYADIAADLNVSLEKATYLTTIVLAILGVAPLVWKPLSNRYGRRPIFLISLACSVVANVGCALCHSYSSMAVCRAIVAWFIAPACGIGGAVVTETFFKHERARYMGVWTLMVTVGVPIAPFLFGFVCYHVGYRWIYWILAMINGGELILYIFFGPESRYLRSGVHHEASSIKQEYFNFKRIDPTPIHWIEYIEPLLLGRHIWILFPTCAYAMCFLFGSVTVTVEVPSLFQQKFNLNAQSLGLQFLAVIIGSFIGEQVGGIFSDSWMVRKAKKNDGVKPMPEYRIWLSYPGFLLTIVGTIVFLVQLDHARDGHWNITPLVGIAISGCGNQIVTTILITYCVDSMPPDQSGNVSVFITFVRQIWGFLGPFWLPDMFNVVGVAASSGVATALLVVIGILPVAIVQVWGPKMRGKSKARVSEKQKERALSMAKSRSRA